MLEQNSLIQSLGVPRPKTKIMVGEASGASVDVKEIVILIDDGCKFLRDPAHQTLLMWEGEIDHPKKVHGEAIMCESI